MLISDFEPVGNNDDRSGVIWPGSWFLIAELCGWQVHVADIHGQVGGPGCFMYHFLLQEEKNRAALAATG